jgi:phosphohistidine phosphatase SixA
VQLRRRRLLAATASLVAVGCKGPVTVHLVRHAEKEKVADGPPNSMLSRDPPLSTIGEQRALGLVAALSSVKLAACFATEYRRTQATVEPTARAQGLAVEIVFAEDVDGLCARVLAHSGSHVLVAGHSNTVPEIAKRLGLTETLSLGDDDYGDLFTVEKGSWSASLQRSRFEPS